MSAKGGSLQANVLVPDAEAKALVMQVGARLRSDAGFAERLAELLNTGTLTDAMREHDERIRRLEEQVASLLEARAAPEL